MVGLIIVLVFLIDNCVENMINHDLKINCEYQIKDWKVPSVKKIIKRVSKVSKPASVPLRFHSKSSFRFSMLKFRKFQSLY